MACLVTGGTGLIGAHVVGRFLESGEKVVIYDVAPDIGRLERTIGGDATKAVAVVQGDVLDLPHLIRTARQHQVDRVVHLAYRLGIPTELNPSNATRLNIEGTNNVFEMASIVGAPRVAWASSISVFGPRSAGPDGVIANDAPYHPLSIYGACKVLNESVAFRYARSFGLEPVGLRFPVVYGPEVSRGWAAFVSNLIADLVRRHPTRAPRGDRPFNWIYVGDVAEAVFLAAHVPRPTTLAFTLSGETRTVSEVVEIVARRFPGVEIGIDRDYPDNRLMPYFDASPARQQLGWQARYSLEEGISACIEYYRRLHAP